MKNKTLAIFGLGTYILSVMASAEDLEGNFVAPIVLIIISLVAAMFFYIMATIRLWKINKSVSILFISSALILFVLSVVQSVVLPSYGSPIIILCNIAKIIKLGAFIWAVSLLWRNAKTEKPRKLKAEDNS